MTAGDWVLLIGFFIGPMLLGLAVAWVLTRGDR